MIFGTLVVLFLSTAQGLECSDGVPASNHGLASLQSAAEEIVVTARSETDPCHFANISKNFELGPQGGGVKYNSSEVFPWKRGDACAGEIVATGNARGAKCMVPTPHHQLVFKDGVAFTGHPESDVLIIDVRQSPSCEQCGATDLSTRFSIPRSKILDAQNRYTTITCLPQNCRGYTFMSSRGESRTHFLTITTNPDGTVETRFIVNAGWDSTISDLPPALETQRRAYEHSFLKDASRLRVPGTGHHQDFRQCYADDE